MNKIILFVFALSTITFLSCTKDKKAKACFKFSKSSVSVGDSVYVLNCSENYNRNFWIISGVPVVDSINRHQKIIASGPGTYVVALTVGGLDMNITNLNTKGTVFIDSFKAN